jgi:hypothetical protein
MIRRFAVLIATLVVSNYMVSSLLAKDVPERYSHSLFSAMKWRNN